MTLRLAKYMAEPEIFSSTGTKPGASGSSQSSRPVKHEQAAQFPVSNSPESHEQNARPITMRTRLGNLALLQRNGCLLSAADIHSVW